MITTQYSYSDAGLLPSSSTLLLELLPKHTVCSTEVTWVMHRSIGNDRRPLDPSRLRHRSTGCGCVWDTLQRSEEEKEHTGALLDHYQTTTGATAASTCAGAVTHPPTATIHWETRSIPVRHHTCPRTLCWVTTLTHICTTTTHEAVGESLEKGASERRVITSISKTSLAQKYLLRSLKYLHYILIKIIIERLQAK